MVWAWLLGHPYRMALRRRPRPGHTPWWSPPEAPDAPRQHRARDALLPRRSSSGSSAPSSPRRSPSRPTSSTPARPSRARCCRSCASACWAPWWSRPSPTGAGGGACCSPARRRLHRWPPCPALAPDLVTLGVAQTVVRGAATAGGVLVGIVAAEEMPSGSRAFAFSLLAAAGALGAGPLPDGAPAGRHGRARLAARDGARRSCCCRSCAWRPGTCPRAGATTPPTPRWGWPGHGSRFWLLAVSALLLALFTAPASQLLNEFLRDEEGFSALADHGVQHPHQHARRHRPGDRRPAGRHTRAAGASGPSAWRPGTLLTVAMVLLGGWPMWGLSVAAAIAGRDGRARHRRLRPRAVPHLAARAGQRHHRHPRGHGQRDRAAGRRLAVGASGTAWARPSPCSSIGPLVMAVLVLVAYPETAHRELEDLNPEDRVDPPGAIPSGERGTGRLTAVPATTSLRRALLAPPWSSLGAPRAPARASAPSCRTSTSTTTTSTTEASPPPRRSRSRRRRRSRRPRRRASTCTPAEDADDAGPPDRVRRRHVGRHDPDRVPREGAASDGDERVEVYLPVRPNGSTGWVDADDVTSPPSPTGSRWASPRTASAGVPRRRGHPRRAGRRRPRRRSRPRAASTTSRSCCSRRTPTAPTAPTPTACPASPTCSRASTAARA